MSNSKQLNSVPVFEHWPLHLTDITNVECDKSDSSVIFTTTTGAQFGVSTKIVCNRLLVHFQKIGMDIRRANNSLDNAFRVLHCQDRTTKFVHDMAKIVLGLRDSFE